MRVLLLEDIPSDAELIRREIRRSLPDATFQQVVGREDFVQALAEYHPDLILSDHNVVSFTGRDALGLTRKVAPKVPFIVVTGSLDEETAVEYMRAGADDYILKDRLTRLGPAARRAVEQARHREALRQVESQYRTMFEAAPVGIYQSTPDGRFLTANPALAKMLGYDRPEDLLALNLVRDIYAEPAERERVIAEYEPSGRSATLEFRWKKKDGTLIWIELTACAAKDEHGKTRHFEGFVHDIDQQKRLEDQLRQAQKMEAIGQLAGGVAHDFNNILTAITGYSELVLSDLAPDDPRRADVEEIRKAGQRAAALTRQLLAFSRRQVIQPRPLSLNAVVEDMEDMLRRLLGEHIRLTAALEPDLGTVKADPGQVEQVILNLAVNARDAMPRGGQLTIETANADVDQRYADQHYPIAPGRHTVLAVSDTGVGMDEATQARLFEPFFTTKEKGKGTGLGLATVYGMVKQSGGQIWVYSELGHGTTFKIYFPRVDQAPEDVRRGEPKVVGQLRGHETILLVEDEDAVRGLAGHALQRLGYRVLATASGEEAIRAAQEHAGDIHLVLTDVIMGGMSGRGLVERLIADRPAARVLYMSGYTDDAIVNHGILEPGVAFLEKPFTPEALARKVREVLEGRSGNKS